MADQQPKGVLISYQGDEFDKDFAVRLSRAVQGDTALYCTSQEDAVFLSYDQGDHDYHPGTCLSYKLAIVIFDDKLEYPDSVDYQLPEILFTSKRNIRRNHQYFCPVYYNTSPAKVKMDVDCFDVLSGNGQLWPRWYAAVLELPNFPGWYFKHGDGNESEFIDKIAEDVSRMLHGDPPLHMRREMFKVRLSRTLHKVARVMLSISLVVFQAEMTWRVVGFMSCVVGLLCYALDPSFNRLFGRWNPFKVSLYVVLSLAILTAILKADKASPPTRYVQLKNICITFVILMIISVYSFFHDRVVSGKPNVLSLISNAAFALVSVSLHRLLQFGVEMGVFSYFVGCFTIQLLTINRMLIFIAIIYGFLLFVLHSTMNPQPNVASGRQDNQV